MSTVGEVRTTVESQGRADRDQMAADNASALIEVTRVAIAFDGYAHITQPLSVEDFETLSSRLGSIAMRTDLAITPGRTSIVYKADAIAFHQDNPSMNIIGWHCVQQDAIDGSARLIDTADIFEHFSADELRIMTEIDVRCPDADSNRHNPDKGLVSYFLWPMLIEKPTRSETYYVPWLLLDSYTAEQQAVISKFDEYIGAAKVTNIRLSQGETLFIDNNRMLHGRGPIQTSSKRHLKRVWIRLDS